MIEYQVVRGSDYDFELPEKPGYRAPFPSYKGTANDDEVINLKYYTRDCVVIARFVFKDGTQVRSDMVYYFKYGDEYTIYAWNWPDYVPDKDTISGTIDDNTNPMVVVKFIYTHE